MKPQWYGFIGIASGLLAIGSGLPLLSNPAGSKGEIGVILLICGAFVFGCGLVAAAITAAKRVD